jgi:hypothetical protein
MDAAVRAAWFGNVVNALLLIGGLVGVYLTYASIKMNEKISKATFFKDLYTTMYGNSDVTEAFYQIENETLTYDETFSRSANRRSLDRLLGFVNLVCDLHKQGILTQHEMNFFSYRMIRIFRNKNVQGYLGYLKTAYGHTELGTNPFPSFIAYCESIQKRVDQHSQSGHGSAELAKSTSTRTT